MGHSASIPTYHLPDSLGGGGKPTIASGKREGSKPKKGSGRQIDKAAEPKAALAYEREQARRKILLAREEAARQRKRMSRQRDIDEAQSALDEAQRKHTDRASAFQTEAEALDKKSQAEDVR